MTEDDYVALDTIRRRIDHVAIIAQMIGEGDDTRVGSAVAGLGEVLSEAADRLDAILNPLVLTQKRDQCHVSIDCCRSRG